MLFNGRTLIFTFSGTQVRIAEHEQSLFKTSMVHAYVCLCTYVCVCLCVCVSACCVFLSVYMRVCVCVHACVCLRAVCLCAAGVVSPPPLAPLAVLDGILYCELPDISLCMKEFFDGLFFAVAGDGGDLSSSVMCR